MDKRTRLNTFIPLAVVTVVLSLVMPRSARFSYDYRKGREWKYETLFAQFDFPIYKTEEQMREERSSMSAGMIPYYRYSDEQTNRTLRSVESLDLGPARKAVLSSLRRIYAKGVVSDDIEKKTGSGAGRDLAYLQKDKRAVKIPSSELYRLTEAREKLFADVRESVRMNVDSVFRACGLYDLIVPNVIYDRQTTELVYEESGETVSPTSGYVTAGQLIVQNGELVTADVAQMLDSYKKEYESNMGYPGSPFLVALGNLIIALCIAAMLFFAVRFSNPLIFQDTRYSYILVVFTLFAVISLIIVRIDEKLLYFVPFTLVALLLKAFMKPKVIIPVYMISLVPALVFIHDGAVFFCMYFIAGMVSMYVVDHFLRGWKQFILAFITFAALGLCFLGFRAADLVAGSVWRVLLDLFVGSMLTVAGYPLIYLFEKIFNLVSDSRLLELCDTSSPVIRELEKKAPGTFQHSLQVMNMAEAVARAVDINPDLVRVGALYHDIGKMSNPLCFVENESIILKENDEKYHSSITPLQSARDIIRHVEDGVETARRHYLPSVITDMIRSHHGTTLARFFYEKYLRAGGDPGREAEFRYNGVKPVTKAQAVLMICDSIEAASRTLRDHSQEAYARFVSGIIQEKMDDGQLDKADVSIGELGIIKDTLAAYLGQLHHGRIAYPKRTKTRKNKNTTESL